MTDKPAVLITGCSTGIGRATAERLLASGRWTVCATARNPESLKELAAAGAMTRRLDTTDEASMSAVIDELNDNLYGVINNAGYGEYGVVEELPVEALRRGFETNVVGPVRLCQLALPGMRARGEGRIVFLGSLGGRFTLPAGAGYHVTKYALESLADALRYEVSPFGIHVTLVQPGLVRTAFGSTAVSTLNKNSIANGPYASLAAGVGSLHDRAFNNPDMGVSPDEVAAVVEKALIDANPATREVVTDDMTLIDLRDSMDDHSFDGVLRQMHG